MNIQEFLANVLYLVSITAIPLAVTAFRNYLNHKIDKLQTESRLANYEQLNEYIDSAQSIVDTIVTSVSQTYVSRLKVHGSFTSEAQLHAKEEAVSKAKALISHTMKDAVTEIYGDFDVWLDTIIEKSVSDNKPQT